MAEYASRGDPKVTMALLWETAEPPGRGPKPSLTVADIVTAAVELADAEGLAGLSMRKVAERLGRSAMSLYTYIPGKAELVDLMLDRTAAELPTSYSLDAGWRAAVEACARAHWSYYESHPWILHVSTSRAVLGPHGLDEFESQVRLFDGIGLTAEEMLRAAGAVGGFVLGSACTVADARGAVTGQSDDDWWSARSPLLHQLGDDLWTTRYPTISKIQAERAFDQVERDVNDDTPYTVREALDAFEFGLARLLDGIDTLVRSRQRGVPQ